MNISSHKLFHFHALTAFVGVVALSALGLFANMQPAVAGEPCLNDLAGFNNATCTANDVRISRINVLDGPTQCEEGKLVTIDSLEAEVLGGAKQRYDIGMYLALDGGDAKSSVSGANDGCRRDILNPAGVNLEQDDAADMCNDIEQGVTETKPLANLEIECQDTDGDGFLDVGTCLSWDNNAKDTCVDVNDVVPGTPSKCRCEPIRVGDIVVIPKGEIVIQKIVRNIKDDPTVFTFEGDVSGAITEQQTISVGGLEPGVYTSTEIVPVSYILENVECDDEDSVGDKDTATATIYLDADETVTCTFTNAAGG
ncbi:MAG: hypothetical protein R3E62_09335 [Pseudomonadales bacterium]